MLDDIPPGFVTVKLSVRHWVLLLAALPLWAPVVTIEVSGPPIAKVSKSNRSWQMSLLSLQIRVVQAPTSLPVFSTYVLFSLEVAPQFLETKVEETFQLSPIKIESCIHKRSRHRIPQRRIQSWFHPSPRIHSLMGKKVCIRLDFIEGKVLYTVLE